MFGDRRRLLMSGGVIAVLVLAMWVMWPSPPASSASGPAPARGAQQAAQPNPTPVAPVKIDSLTAPRQAPADSSRNPFRYQPKAPPPPAPRPATTGPPVVDNEPPKPMMPTGPPPPAPIPLKFIGILERANGVKWAVLTDGKTLMHGRDGDIVIGQYRIVKIGTESIEMTYVDGRGRQVIRLTGQ
jgi:hypothetical protein